MSERSTKIKSRCRKYRHEFRRQQLNKNLIKTSRISFSIPLKKKLNEPCLSSITKEGKGKKKMKKTRKDVYQIPSRDCY